MANQVMNTAVWLSDWHVPFHDKAALKAALAYIKTLKPGIIILGGDIVDFPQISKFDFDPSRKTRLKYDVEIAKKYFAQIRKDHPRAKIVFLEGNHSLRLSKYLLIKAPELCDLDELSLSSLLELDKYGIEFYPHDEPFMLTRDFVCVHGTVVRKFAGYSAKGEMDKWGCSGISGHTHRLSTYFETKRGRTAHWTEGGCLCSMDPHYMKNPNWQSGFVVLHLKGATVTPEIIRL